MKKSNNIAASLRKNYNLLAMCVPLAIAVICTACNYVSAAGISNISNPEYTDTDTVFSSVPDNETTSDNEKTDPDVSEKPVESDGEKQPERNYAFTEEMQKYFDDFAVVGDSIGSGYVNCGYIKPENDFARPCVAAWNIHQFLISNDNIDTDVLMHVYRKQPKYILFVMGLNDVNLTTAEEFVDNYMTLLYQCKEASPNSEMIVMGITPVRSKFCKNETIDSYNSMLKYAINNSGYSHYYFVDPSEVLKGSDNRLLEKYAFEDGTHLVQSGMEATLCYLYEQGIKYSFTEDEMKEPKRPDISMYTYLY